MKVLVLWADNESANYGVRVLAQGMAALARQAWGPDTVVDFQDYGKGTSQVAFGTKGILKDLRAFGKGALSKRLGAYDVILDSGAGDSFADIYGLKRLSFMIYAQRRAQQLGKTLVLGPQTIGPFNTRIGRLVGTRTLKKADLVMARDTQSAAYAKKLGQPVDITVTDVVFSLPPVERGTGHDVLLNPSGLLWYPNHHVDAEAYQKNLKALVEALRERGRRVALLGHTISRTGAPDDITAARELAERLDGEIEIISPAGLDEMRELMGTAQLVIGSRMHACLNALSVGTPSVPWAYSRKFAPLMGDIGWKRVVDIRTDTDPVTSTFAFLDAPGIDDEVAALRTVTDAKFLQAAEALRSVA